MTFILNQVLIFFIYILTFGHFIMLLGKFPKLIQQYVAVDCLLYFIKVTQVAEILFIRKHFFFDVSILKEMLSN